MVTAEIVATRSRPILFKDEMVWAIINNMKTQTRRIIRPEMAHKKCPYGTAGDTLWVRECFQKIGSEFVYRSTIPGGNNQKIGWKPSIFMPREACRLELLIKSVRVEFLNSISEADAIAEGALGVGDFRALWRSINGYASWDLNPMVWVVEFEKIRG